jgi:hypothetical protein
MVVFPLILRINMLTVDAPFSLYFFWLIILILRIILTYNTYQFLLILLVTLTSLIPLIMAFISAAKINVWYKTSQLICCRCQKPPGWTNWYHLGRVRGCCWAARVTLGLTARAASRKEGWDTVAHCQGTTQTMLASLFSALLRSMHRE